SGTWARRAPGPWRVACSRSRQAVCRHFISERLHGAIADNRPGQDWQQYSTCLTEWSRHSVGSALAEQALHPGDDSRYEQEAGQETGEGPCPAHGITFTDAGEVHAAEEAQRAVEALAVARRVVQYAHDAGKLTRETELQAGDAPGQHQQQTPEAEEVVQLPEEAAGIAWQHHQAVVPARLSLPPE